MADIDSERLAELASAFITYELAKHNVDPRETLEGTTFRIESNEGYKYEVYERAQKKIHKGLPYIDVVLDAISSTNLVSYYQKDYLNNLIERDGSDELEHALGLLYEDNDDEKAFNQITNIIGGRFDIVGLIFFIKDCNKYLPIRSRIFDSKFKVLGIDSNLEGNCCWDKYNDYLSWITAVQQFLKKHISKSITLLDAHSFLWIIDGIDYYATNSVKLVEHKKFGHGEIVGYDEDYVFVKFGKSIKQFDKEKAFKDGFLRLIPSDFDIYINSYETESKQGQSIPPLSKKAKEVLEVLLQQILNRKWAITYGELSALTESKPTAYHEIPKILDAINARCELLELPFISAMVINKDTNLPGKGFTPLYERKYGYSHEVSPEEIYHKELDRIKQCDRWDQLANTIGFKFPKQEMPVDPELVRINDKEDNQLVNDLKNEPLIDVENSFQYIAGKKNKGEPKIIGGYKAYPRDKQTAINALAHACYKCEIDSNHYTFIRRGSDKPYTEPHHLIPMAFSEQFDVSLDREQNIVSLCSNCHNEIHYGRDAKVLIEKLYNERKDLLKSAGIEVTLEQLLKMYDI